MLLVLGFFTCGFQLAFITVHLPSYLIDRGLSAEVGGWTLAVIGLFNIVGSLTSGYLGNRMPKRYILSVIYFARAAVDRGVHHAAGRRPTATLIFGAVTGLLWLSTVPPTSALVAVMFGTRWLAMLFGFAFFSHQVGGFLGVLLGGIAFERLGSYNPVWWLSVLFGVLSALINLPIVEKPVARPALARPDGACRRLRPRAHVVRTIAQFSEARRRVATFKAIVIEKADSGTKAALTDFDEANLMDGDVTVRVEYSTSTTRTASPSPARRRSCAASR